jgi:hypothetical protein
MERLRATIQYANRNYVLLFVVLSFFVVDFARIVIIRSPSVIHRIWKLHASKQV